ncbi:MAG TPA: response regulator [Chitinophagaceae bacterium]|nr:response regulator [Chitinophagaceae bacterium]
MLIDDDEPTNFLSQMIIEEAGCSEFIQVADSGEKAIDYLLNSQKFGYNDPDYPWPDLIFLDINMPAMNGWEFLEKYKELRREHDSNTIIIMLTTSLNPDDKNKANDISDVTDFKHKPLTEEIVKEVLQKYFVDYVNGNPIPLNAEKIYNLN